MNITEAKKLYGSAEFGGETYIMLCGAYASNYRDGIRYYAECVKRSDCVDGVMPGDIYQMAWDTTDEWDSHRYDGVIHPDGESCGFCEEEENACDWDNPVLVIQIK